MWPAKRRRHNVNYVKATTAYVTMTPTELISTPASWTQCVFTKILFLSRFEILISWVDDKSPVDLINLYSQKASIKFHTTSQVKITWYGKPCHRLDRAVADWQNTWGSCCGRRAYKLENSIEWGATRICTSAYFIFNIQIWLEERVASKILKYAENAKLYWKTKESGDKHLCEE